MKTAQKADAVVNTVSELLYERSHFNHGIY